MVPNISNMSKDAMSVMTPYLTIPDVMKLSLTSTKFDKYYKKCFDNDEHEIFSRFNLGKEILKKSWWIKNHNLVQNLDNYEDFQQILYIISQIYDDDKTSNIYDATVVMNIINHLLAMCNKLYGCENKCKVVNIIFKVIKLNKRLLIENIKFGETVFLKAFEFMSTSNMKYVSMDMIFFIIENIPEGDKEYTEMICKKLSHCMYKIKRYFDKKEILKLMHFYLANHQRTELYESKTENLCNLSFTIIDVINFFNDKMSRNIFCDKIINNISFIETNFDEENIIKIFSFYIQNHNIYHDDYY